MNKKEIDDMIGAIHKLRIVAALGLILGLIIIVLS